MAEEISVLEELRNDISKAYVKRIIPAALSTIAYGLAITADKFNFSAFETIYQFGVGTVSLAVFLFYNATIEGLKLRHQEVLAEQYGIKV